MQNGEPVVPSSFKYGKRTYRSYRRVLYPRIIPISKEKLRKNKIVPMCGNPLCVRPHEHHCIAVSNGSHKKLPQVMEYSPVIQRILPYIKMNGTCMVWCGYFHQDVPVITVPTETGRGSGKRRSVRHVLKGAGRKKLIQKCKTDDCVNPEHFSVYEPSKKTKPKGFGYANPDRFWKYVEKGPGCWNWVGNASGQILWEGTPRRFKQVAWFLEKGEWSEYSLIPQCGNKKCTRVHPWHVIPTKGKKSTPELTDVKQT